MKKLLSLLFLYNSVITIVHAQPANDEPCNATVLPIVESADGCTPVNFTVTGATFSNVAGTGNCGTLPDVWFKFNTPGERMKLLIKGTGIVISTYTYSNCANNLTEILPCLDSTALATFVNGSGVFETGINQLIRITNTNGNANFSFSICATLLRPAASQRVGINTTIPTANLDVAGMAVFRDTLYAKNIFRYYKGGNTNNYILKSDANGVASWTPPMVNYWAAFGNNIYNSNAGNVGIGTSAPKAKLHVADSAVVFTGPATLPTATTFAPPVEGVGSRMMWYPQRAALRAGYVNGTQWDKDSIGVASFATGISTKASGMGSMATGYQATASGAYSFAVGTQTTASQDNSIAMGYQTTASGYYSTTMGLQTIASSNASTAMGNQTIASGYSATAMGSNTTASASFSTAMGYQTIASGAYSTAIGNSTIASSNYGLAIGAYNEPVANGSLFEIGNGSVTNRQNAMTVLSNGNVGIGTVLPDAPLAFKNITGNKIDLYSSSNANKYGIGVQGSMLQIYADQVNSDIAFGYGASNNFTEKMRIKGNGNVGIGAIAPHAQIQLGNTTSPRKIILYEAANNDHQFSGFGLEPAFIRYQLASTGGSHSFFAATSANTSNELFRINGNGNATLAGILTQSSDARLKTNIRPISTALQQLQKINGYTYNWIDATRDSSLQIGVLAQEVQQVYPELVHQNEKGELSVNYSGLVPVLIEAIKELKNEIEVLKNKK